MALIKNQLSTIDFKKNIKLLTNGKKDQPVNLRQIKFDKDQVKEKLINEYLHEVKAMLNYNNVQLGAEFDMEISHHKGINNFRKTGCFLFNIVNRNYAKKILVMLPNQRHPSHRHIKKTESFILLFGKLFLKDGKKTHRLNIGDVVHLKSNSWHEFKAGKDGCIFEEISTTSFKKDSFYIRAFIIKMK